ncbi:MAG: endolytic transglycosylase MltG [Bacteroidota bacterium]
MRKNWLVLFIVVFSTMLSSFAFYFYQVVYTPNFQLDKDDINIVIQKGATFKDVQDLLYDNKIVNDLVAFSLLAKLMNYDEAVKPGVYTIKKDMPNLLVVRRLRSGDQVPVRITFNNIRLIEELPEKITTNTGVDPEEFRALLDDDEVIQKLGFNRETIVSMFIPNTYEVYWTITAEELLNKMKTEYDRFWSETRLAKAKQLNMTPLEVSTLASIVQAETQKFKEAATVAGLYINRLQRNIALQADPTLVFAAQDFTIKRVLNVHKEIDSPYNTYMYSGLPPGPINMPQPNYLDAVLNYEEHRYLYMCAKEDFSGYHSFATNLSDHLRNAEKYQTALNRAGLYR